MQPHRDDVPGEPPRPPPPRQKQPMFNLPAVVVVLIGALVAIHGLMEAQGPRGAFDRVLDFGFVPAAWTVRFDPDALQEVARRALEHGGEVAEREFALARYVLARAEGGFWTVLTYAFLHGSWLHVGLNAVWLAAFGAPIARRVGTERFLFIAGITAIAGAALHWVTNPYEATPMIGASATVSGMMAAAARFAFSPRGFGGVPPHLAPRLGLGEMLRNRTTVLFIVVWFVVNLVFGLAAVPLGLATEGGGIAWEAHIGGFVAGLLLFPFFDPGPARS